MGLVFQWPIQAMRSENHTLWLFSKPRLRVQIRLRLAWPRGCFDIIAHALCTCSGLQTRGRSLSETMELKLNRSRSHGDERGLVWRAVSIVSSLFHLYKMAAWPQFERSIYFNSSKNKIFPHLNHSLPACICLVELLKFLIIAWLIRHCLSTFCK